MQKWSLWICGAWDERSQRRIWAQTPGPPVLNVSVTRPWLSSESVWSHSHKVRVRPPSLLFPPGHTTSWLTSISQSLWPSPPLRCLCLPPPLSLLIRLPRRHAEPFAHPPPPFARDFFFFFFNSPAGCFPLIFTASPLAPYSHRCCACSVYSSSACSRIVFHHFILSASVSRWVPRPPASPQHMTLSWSSRDKTHTHTFSHVFFCTHWSFSTARRDLSREHQHIARVASPSRLCNHQQNFLLSRSAVIPEEARPDCGSNAKWEESLRERLCLPRRLCTFMSISCWNSMTANTEKLCSAGPHDFYILDETLFWGQKRASLVQYLHLICRSSIRVTSSHTFRQEAGRI